MKTKAVIVLGSSSFIEDYSRYLKTYDSDAILLVVDKNTELKLKISRNMRYFHLKTKRKAVEIISTYCEENNLDVIAVINRVDSFELLHGKLCDFFHVAGPNQKAVKKLINKDIMHRLMIDADLSFYRPRTIISSLDEAVEHLEKLQFPVVLKVHRGVKSRGVVTLNEKKDYYYYRDLFVKEGIFNQNTIILFEQMILGKQVTPVMYVDSVGKVNILALVDVVTARETKQNHMQLVYRTTPSFHSEAIRQKISYVMQKIVSKVKLKSVMLHPEFIVVGKNIYLIEINVRIGGFRYQLMKHAYDISLNKISWDIALGDLHIQDYIQSDSSCTACEVWEEKSGKIKEIKFPKSQYVHGFSQQKFVGDEYIAPPAEQKALAKFYVITKENSLTQAKKLRKKIKVEFE